MFDSNPSLLADARLPRVGVTLAFTRKPEEKIWRPEDCAVAEDGTYRLITSNVFIAEDMTPGFMSVGAGVMVDALRSDKWKAYCEDQHRTADHRADIGNVFRDGLLSMRRGLTKISEKAADRSVPNVKTAYRLLDAVLMKGYTLDVKNPAAMKAYGEDLLAIGAMFETSGDELKEEIREYIHQITLDDRLQRENKERWPLMFMKAKSLVMNLKRKLSSWETEAEDRRDSVSGLIESLLVDADGFRVIALQAANSRALLGDEGQVDNKDNAVLAWRHYRDALQGATALPFRLWFRRAGLHYGAAIKALERDDMSGLQETRKQLLAAEACLRVPRIMDMVDAVTLPVSRAREFGTDEAFQALRKNRASLAVTLTEAGGMLVDVEATLDQPDLSPDLKLSAFRRTFTSLTDAEGQLSPFNEFPNFTEKSINDIYNDLVNANRALMSA